MSQRLTPAEELQTTLGFPPNPPARRSHPTRTPTQCPPAPPPPRPTQAEPSITLSMAVLDSMAGHVIGRAGTGLRLIHDFSHVKVNISSHVGPAASRTVTIRGTSKEVGDAVVTIGRQIAKHRI